MVLLLFLWECFVGVFVGVLLVFCWFFCRVTIQYNTKTNIIIVALTPSELRGHLRGCGGLWCKFLIVEFG